jgi:hypothetical protein
VLSVLNTMPMTWLSQMLRVVAKSEIDKSVLRWCMIFLGGDRREMIPLRVVSAPVNVSKDRFRA